MLACLTNEKLTEEMPDKEADIQVVTVPTKLKRCGIETRFVINDLSDQGPHQITVRGLQNTLLRALRWHEELVSGAVASTTDLAKRENLAQRYVAFILKLAFLAPDIMEAIINGNIPVNLTIAHLKKGFPMDWTLQRQALGFTPQ